MRWGHWGLMGAGVAPTQVEQGNVHKLFNYMAGASVTVP